MWHRVGAGLAALLTLLALPVAAPGQSGKRPVVTAAAQVTTDESPTRAHSAPQIARNPKTGDLVIVEADPRGDERCRVHISTDDGRSWFAGGDPMRTPFTDCTFHAEYGPYATMTFSEDGSLYVAFVANDPNVPQGSEDSAAEGGPYAPRSVFLARSSDGGRSFRTATVFRAPSDDVDRGLNKGPTLAVAPNDSSRMYVGWRQGSFSSEQEKLKSVVAASSDGGRTFSAPVDLSDDQGGDYPGLAVDSDGTLHAVYWSRSFPSLPFGDPKTPLRPIYYRKSTDNGKTFGKRVTIDPGSQGTERPPRIAADPNSDALYVVWNNTAEKKNLVKDFQGDTDIFFLASRDSGKAWSARRVLNDDRNPKADQSLPGLSVSPSGRLDLAWYDDRLNVGKGEEVVLQNVFYTSSRDQGATFTPNVRISDRGIDRRIGVWGNNIESNDSVGIASTNDAAYFAWQDSRAGSPRAQAEDVYTAKLAYGRAGVAGDGDSDAVWAFLGAGAALALGGLVLLAGTRLARRAPPEGVPEGAER